MHRWGLALVALALGACASPPIQTERGWLSGDLAAEIEPGQTAAVTLAPRELRDAERVWLALVVEEGPEDAAGARMLIESRGERRMVSLWIDGEESWRWRRALRRDEDRLWRLMRFDDATRGWITQFTPGLVTLDPGVVPGETVATEAKLAVRSRENPRRVRHRGSGDHTFEVLGRQAITIGGETVEAIVVRTTLKSRFGFATAESETRTWLHAEHGLLAEQSSEVVRFAGLQADSTRWTLVRAPASAVVSPRPR